MLSLMIMIMFVVVFGRVCGRILGETERTWQHRRMRELRWKQRDDSTKATPLPPTRTETPIEALQRRFANGEITIEQYEREVGRHFGVKE